MVDAGKTPLSRRRVLAGMTGAAAVALFAPGMAVGASPPYAGFVALSETITGKKGLDDEFGRPLFDALLADPKEGPVLGDLIAGRLGRPRADANGDLLQALKADIRAAWYSGTRAAADGKEIYSYQEALAWRALTFTKPPGVCGGLTGYWADPPES